MDFDLVVLVVIALSVAINWQGKPPKLSNSWLTHVSSLEQACASVDGGVCAPNKPSRWVHR